MFRKLSAFFVLGLVGTLPLATGAQAGGLKKIRVLIIDGQNNHNWKATTPVMKKALEDCGRFTVDVATTPSQPKAPQNPDPTVPKKPAKPREETPEKLKKYEQDTKKYDSDLAKYHIAKKNFDDNKDQLEKAYREAKIGFARDQAMYKQGMARFRPDLTKVDVVLSNYNGDTWPKEFQSDLEQTLKDGKIGLVIVHAANNSFSNWVQYNLMIGMGWRGEKFGKRLKVDDNGMEIIVPAGEDQGSGHRYAGPFQVFVRDASHPITRGMPREWLHYNDELYDNMRGPIENIHLLATAYSKGTRTNEPMIWTVDYFKGRVFHTPMGHDAGSMTCVGFITTLQRGTEWAATGSVTIPIPENFPSPTKASTVKK